MLATKLERMHKLKLKQFEILIEKQQIHKLFVSFQPMVICVLSVDGVFQTNLGTNTQKPCQTLNTQLHNIMQVFMKICNEIHPLDHEPKIVLYVCRSHCQYQWEKTRDFGK